MFRELFPSRGGLISAGERARRLHGAWLTRALADPRRRFPRIPTRPVRDGGFSAVTATPAGRAWATAWWAGAFDELE